MCLPSSKQLTLMRTNNLRLGIFLMPVFFFLFAGQVCGQQALQKLKTYAQVNQKKLGIGEADIATISVTHDYVDASTGVQHIYASQKINGLQIVNSNFSLHTNSSQSFSSNQLVSTVNYKVNPAAANITSKDAIEKLMSVTDYKGDRNVQLKLPEIGLDKVTVYKRSASSIWDIPARLVYYKMDKLKTLQPAWEVQMMDANQKHYWVAYINASTGKVIEKIDLILKCNFGGAETDINAHVSHRNHQHRFAESVESNQPANNTAAAPYIIPNNSYRVYDLPLESPVDNIQQPAPHSLSTRSGDLIASPDGWHRVGNAITYPFTRGNNVWSFQDPSPGPLAGVPSADPTRTAYPTNTTLGIPPVVEPFVFDYPVNLASQPEVYQKAAIVNLFYWNNLMHDVFYQLGFTEAAGNFQESHTFSTGTKPGGAAGDAVWAQAQDGGGTNNANFLTLPDGTPAGGQMQMYLWTGSFPDSLVQITSSSTGVPPANTKFLAVQGSFSTAPTANTNLYTNPVLNKQFVLVQKNALSIIGNDTEGCTTGQQSIALPPGNNVTDKIVLIDRGNCSFAEKVLGAQLGGAAGVIVINNADGPPQAMGGTDAPANLILIPAVMISKADGEILKAQISGGATIIGSLKQDAPPPPKRDGDFDNGVIAHEYGHGISSRMTAPNTLGSLGGDEQGGEGWSDFMGIYMTMRSNDLLPPTSAHPNGVLPTRSIGNYVTYQQADGSGIRPTPYSIDRAINPSTFKDIGKGQEITIPHGVGYIWASMLYDLLQTFVDQYGMGDDVYEGASPTAAKIPPPTAKGNNIAMRLVMEGMKLQGTSPTFVRQRDAILRADTLLYNGMHGCRIWQAFAGRGLGYSAASNTDGVGDEFESFDVPISPCNPNQKRIRIDKSGPGKSNNNTNVSYTIKITNMYATPVSVVVKDTLATTLTFVSATDNPTVSGKILTWNLNLAANETRTISLVTLLNASTTSSQTFGDDHEGSSANWVASVEPLFPGTDIWTRQTDATKAYSGLNYWYVPNPDGFAHTSLRTANPITVPANAELVLIHKYSTEEGFDGGIVEISTNGGTSWTYLPPNKFVQNGYSGVIPLENNPAIAAPLGATTTAAFSGTTDGYVVSIAKLEDYAGQNVHIRFRFSSDVGTGVEGGGWWLDDVYVLTNRTEVHNRATAITTPADPMITNREGANARSAQTGAFIIGGSTLASNLGALSASVSRQTIDLSWNTNNEINSVAFDVEKRINGQNDFTKVGSVNAKSSSGTNTYKFNDANVSQGQRYQYRIKQVNNNGEFYYTNIATVTLGGKAFGATIYPNPANGIANISISNPGAAKVVLNMFDVLGRKVGTFNGTESVSQIIPLPVHTMQAGTYWVEVRSGENTTTLKLEVKK